MTGTKKTIVAVIIFVVLLGLVLLTQNDPYEKKEDADLPKMPELDKASIDKVELVNTTEAFTFEKKSSNWYIAKPEEHRAEDTFEVMVLDKLAKIEIERIVSKNKSKHESFEVDEKGTRVKLYSNGKELLSVIIGKTTPDYRGTFFRLPESNTVYASKGILGSSLKRSLRDWRFKKLMDITRVDIEKVNFNLGKKDKFAFVLTPAPVNPNATEGEPGPEASWKLEGDDKVELDQSKVTSLLNSATGMVWAEVVDEPKDLKEYGLLKPDKWVEFVTKDKNTIKLDLGNVIEDKNLASIVVEGQKPVYQVRKFQYDKLTKKLDNYKISK